MIGMLKEIPTSILRSESTLAEFVLPVFQSSVRSQKTRTPKWAIADLQAALFAIIEQRKVTAQILLFLDALDEHQGDNDHLAAFLKRLVDKADNDCMQLRLCLASRSWTVYEHHFGRCPGFAIHNHTNSDILIYTRDRLKLDRIL